MEGTRDPTILHALVFFLPVFILKLLIKDSPWLRWEESTGRLMHTPAEKGTEPRSSRGATE